MSQATSSGTPGAPGPGPSSEPEPLGAIVHRLSEQIPDLIRSELKLAQAELTQKGKAAGLGAGLFGGAGVVGLYGLGALLVTIGLLLDLAMPGWAAALIVTVALFALAAVLALVGKKEVAQATPAAPERAVAGLKEDVATIKGGHQS